jgi:hypothetical protein
MNAIFILDKIPFMIFDSSYNVGAKALAIFLRWHEECTSHKIIGINNWHPHRQVILLPMIRRVNRIQVMARLNNWSKILVIIERFHTKVLTIWIKRRADV